MFDPPPGYADLEADADRAPAHTGPYFEVTVDGVGTIHTRTPGPAGTAALAMAANSTVSDRERLDHLDMFVRTHLQPGEFENLLTRMITDETCPMDAMLSVSRAISTAGTARPYLAVINLALVAGHNWRALRTRLRGNGIADPMVLPSMHDILDEAETMALEAAAAGADSADEARRKVTQLLDRLYAPDRTEARDGAVPVPSGFSVEEVEGSFDAFTAAIGV